MIDRLICVGERGEGMSTTPWVLTFPSTWTRVKEDYTYYNKKNYYFDFLGD